MIEKKPAAKAGLRGNPKPLSKADHLTPKKASFRQISEPSEKPRKKKSPNGGTTQWTHTPVRADEILTQKPLLRGKRWI